MECCDGERDDIAHRHVAEPLGPVQHKHGNRPGGQHRRHGCLGGEAAGSHHPRMPGRVNIQVFSPYLYRFRNLVERFFNKLNHFRAITTRFEKHDDNYLALVKLVAARIWMRFISR